MRTHRSRFVSGSMTMALAMVLLSWSSPAATVWYLGHSGFAVEIGQKLLVFDYTPDQGSASSAPNGGGLGDGVIHLDDLRGKDVIVFTSHAHGDHYNPVILGWEEGTSSIHYVFGWRAGDNPRHHYLEGPRATVEIEGVKVFTVNSSPDGVPEVAFLVEVEGLWIYHNGDHYTSGTDDLDYLTGLTSRVDVAFLPGVARFRDTWVEKEILFVERFNPGVVFPMHLGRREGDAEAWIRILRENGLDPTVLAPMKRGDRFHLGG